MNLKPFDFSKKVNKLELYQHLCYYHNEADNNLHLIDENRQLAFSNFKELYHLLRDEYKEYDKSKNADYILFNEKYNQYVSNIRDAYANCTDVNSYGNLSSNLYDIYDYMRYGFEEIFCIDDELDSNKIDSYLGKICCIELKNHNVYIGQVDIKLYDNETDNNESISVLFLENWHQIEINDIDKIKIIEE